MDEREAYEADLFKRYETRIVALEYAVDGLRVTADRYIPIVDKLRDNELVAEQIAARLRASSTLGLSKVHVAIGIAALFVPSIVGAILTALLVRGRI